MRRIARHLFTFAAALSLVVSVSAVGAWLRAPHIGDQWVWRNTPADALRRGNGATIEMRQWQLTLTGRGIQVERTRMSSPVQPGDPPPRESRWRPGFAHAYGLPQSHASLRPLALAGRGVVGSWVHEWPGGFGTAWAKRSYPGVTVETRAVAVPLWSVAVVFAVSPLACWLGYRRRLRARGRLAGGLCAACGYDLRASPGRCPECGAGILVTGAT